MTTSAVHGALAQEAAERVRVGGGDALAVQVGGPAYSCSSGTAIARRQRPKSSSWICWKLGRAAARFEREALLLHDVEADDAEIADVFLHQVGDVVVAHEQHIERHVLAVAHELVLAAAVLQAAAHQQVERVVGEPAGLLHGHLQALVLIHAARLLQAC